MYLITTYKCNLGAEKTDFLSWPNHNFFPSFVYQANSVNLCPPFRKKRG